MEMLSHEFRNLSQNAQKMHIVGGTEHCKMGQNISQRMRSRINILSFKSSQPGHGLLQQQRRLHLNEDVVKVRAPN